MKLRQLASACSLTVLITALPAMARTTVTESGDNYLVNMGDGCVIVVDRHGREKSSSDQCSSRDIRDAEDAVDDYRHGRHNSSDYDRGHSSSSSHRNGRVYYEVHGSGDGRIKLRRGPGEKYDTVTTARNGERLLKRGDCERHHDHNWCEVEYDGERGWARKEYLRETSNHSSSSHNSSRHSREEKFSDLVGSRASSADSELRDRGFKHVDTFKSGYTSYSIWFNNHTDQCLQMAIADGRADSIVDIHRHDKCR